MNRTLRTLLLAGALLLGAAGACAEGAGEQQPALQELLQRIVSSADCFKDAAEAARWHRRMEPRLERFVPTHAERIALLDHVYCEARRDPKLMLPPDLVLALIDVESRFNRWAVSRSGAVGLMQVMPFWPLQLGADDQLVEVAPNIRIGCEILRYYLRTEHNDWSRALARYNGSFGQDDYPRLILSRWRQSWRL